MILQQMLKHKDHVRGFFERRCRSKDIVNILSIVAIHVQGFPEEMRTNDSFLAELRELKETKDMSGYRFGHAAIRELIKSDTVMDAAISQAEKIMKEG